jgi:hypothetical protein
LSIGGNVDPVEIARWQFGITTVYHFWLVPLTLGLGPLVAIMQTAWVRTGKEKYLRMVKFWGKLYLINFILGVATGLVQEFQFGMAWSEYSRFVGDVFGAPLAMEVCGSSAGANCRKRSTSRPCGLPLPAPFSPPTSSWSPTPGCSTRSASSSSTDAP